MKTQGRVVLAVCTIAGGIAIGLVMVRIANRGDAPASGVTDVSAEARTPETTRPKKSGPTVTPIETPDAAATSDDPNEKRKEIVDTLNGLFRQAGAFAMAGQRDGELFFITKRGDCDRKALSDFLTAFAAMDMHIDKAFTAMRCAENGLSGIRIDFPTPAETTAKQEAARKRAAAAALVEKRRGALFSRAKAAIEAAGLGSIRRFGTTISIGDCGGRGSPALDPVKAKLHELGIKSADFSSLRCGDDDNGSLTGL